MDAVRLFNEGKSWECGIPLCKELATLYETDLYNYTKLAKILVSNSYNGRNFSSVGTISKFFSFSENLEKTASDGMFSSKMLIGPKFSLSPTYSPRFFVKISLENDL